MTKKTELLDETDKTELLADENIPDEGEYTAIAPIEIQASNSHDVEKRTTDRDKAFKEFMGLDLSDEEIDQLGYSELAVDIGENGKYKLIRIKDKDSGRNLRHRMVASLYARGFQKSEIAKATGYTPGAVTNILKIGWVRDAIMMFQDKIITNVERDKNLALSRMGELSLEAVDTYERGLYSEDENIQHKSARAILEGIGVYDTKKSSDSGSDNLGEHIGNLIRQGAVESAEAAVRVKFKKDEENE